MSGRRKCQQAQERRAQVESTHGQGDVAETSGMNGAESAMGMLTEMWEMRVKEDRGGKEMKIKPTAKSERRR